MSALTSKTYLIQIITGTLVSLVSFVSIILYTDPYTASLTTHLSFYSTLFFWTSGVFILIGIFLRKILKLDQTGQSIWVSFRQGLLLGVLVACSLMLQSQFLLYWWVIISLVLFLAVVEMIFVSSN